MKTPRTSSSPSKRRGPDWVWWLTVAYDGTSFAGWQRQDGPDTVQQRLEDAAAAIFGCKVTIEGASRTDAGVHATGQIAHFTHPPGARAFSIPEMRRAFNAHLTPEIRVMLVRQVSGQLHCRFSAKAKRYIYSITTGPVPSPLDIHRTWHLPYKLDLPAMRQSSACLVGKHDFSAFIVKSRNPKEHAIRTLHRVEIRGRSPGPLSIIVEGDGFLYRMVRSIAGALVHVGRGKVTTDWIAHRLQTQQRMPGIITAPPEGLTLVKVFYR